jgi:hypothetical protein
LLLHRREVLLFGSIPVIEHSPGWNVTRPGSPAGDFGSNYGWDRTLDELPVLWVESYSSLTVKMLERSYADIMAKHRSYNFKRLTQDYWAERLLRIAKDGGAAYNA